MPDAKHHALAEKACDFLSNSPDPYWAVQNCIESLEEVGFGRLQKRETFADHVEPGGKYYYTVNKTALIAFAVGHSYQPGNGFKVIGGHTDSPNLKVKPHSQRTAAGCVQLAVECYGGGLWHTWFDRDLGVSGRVLVREQDGNVVQRFVKVDRPVARVSTLCIHLQTADERRAFKINREDHLSPVIATTMQQKEQQQKQKAALESSIKEQLTTGATTPTNDQDSFLDGQEPLLMDLLATELQIQKHQIADFELNLFDCQKASIGGIQNEFLYSARLDNLATCFTAVEALKVHAADEDCLKEDDGVSVVVLFDHEEVGSVSMSGAGSPICAEALRRISTALNSNLHNPDLYATISRKSYILSVDMAHAIHPNYASKHEKHHAPLMNRGMVVKLNSNQRYTTNCVTRFVFREVCRLAGGNGGGKEGEGESVPVQHFVVRNDCPCGSTIGPMLSAATGVRTIDVGMPQLSMHSCREVMGVVDLTHGIKCFQSFFKNFSKIDGALEG